MTQKVQKTRYWQSGRMEQSRNARPPLHGRRLYPLLPPRLDGKERYRGTRRTTTIKYRIPSFPQRFLCVSSPRFAVTGLTSSSSEAPTPSKIAPMTNQMLADNEVRSDQLRETDVWNKYNALGTMKTLQILANSTKLKSTARNGVYCLKTELLL